MLLDLNGLPLTDLPGILSVISVFSVVKAYFPHISRELIAVSRSGT